MKKILLITLCAIAFVTIAATTYTITQLTENATPGAGTIIELYDPTASPKSGKITLDSDGFRAAIGLALGTDVQPYDVDLSSLAAGKTGIVLGYGNGLFYDAVTPIAPGVLICPTGINTYEFTTDLTLGTLVVTNTASVSNITVTAAITLSDGAGGEGEVIKKVGGALTWAADETAAGGESSGTVHAPDGATTANRIAVFKDTSGTNITQAAVTVADLATIASPALTGDPTAPTPAENDADTSIATTAYVQTEIDGLGGGNMTNTGASVVGMFPVYTDTTGTQVTPTNALDSVTVNTLILTSLTETNKLLGTATQTNAYIATAAMITNTWGIFTGVETDFVNGAGALKTVLTKTDSQTITNKTFDAAGDGNVLKSTKYLLLMRPDWGDGAGAVPQTNTFTASGLMHYTFSGNAETNANYVVYETVVPPDIDTSVAMTATFAFVPAGDDQDTVTFHIAYGLGVAESAYPVALANIATSPLAFGAVTPPASATGKYLTTAALTLTGWAASMTPGTPLLISVRRIQDDNNVGQRDLYLRIAYGSTQ